jgi:Cu-processing system permease protein
MRAREISLIAARDVREAVRSRWFLVAAVAFLAMSLALSWAGLAGSSRSGLAGFDRTSASLLNLVLLFVPLLTLALGGMGVAGELEDGSLSMVLAQPVTRNEVFVGKYLGLLASVWMAILAGFGFTGTAIGLSVGGSAAAFLGLVGLTLLLAAATLSLGTLLSVALRSRARAAGAAFGTWLLLVYLSDLGTIGLAAARALSPGKVFLLGILNPVQSARVLGILALSDRLDVLGPAGIYGVDRFGEHGVVLALVLLLLAGAVLPLAAGLKLFQHEVIP